MFGFSSGETNGLIVLLPLMVIVLFSQPIYRFLFPPQAFVPTEEQARLDSLIAHWDFNPESAAPILEDPLLFQFDPNTASAEELKSLGFSATLSNRIINYRTKGGRFKTKNDLLKIYGIDSSFFITIAPYIDIPERPEREKFTKSNKIAYDKKIEKFVSINLNLADTAQLKSIRGIGPVLAMRIINYRDKLGGFWTAEQLKEVYGLDSTLIQAITTKFHVEPDYIPKQLNLNTASEKELSRHPYITSKLAKTITAYRYQHGSFTEIDDLLKIDLMNPQVLSNLRPYLKIEP